MLRDEYGCAALPKAPVAASGGVDQAIETVLLGGSSLLRAGLTQLLTGTRFVVVDHHEDATRSGEVSPRPALLIVDASGSFEQTLEFIEAAKRQNPTARVVLIADSFDLGLIRLAISREVDSFCVTTGGREVLINILELTMLGEQVLPAAVLQTLLNYASATASAAQPSSAPELTSPDPRAGNLSPREGDPPVSHGR